MEGVRSFVAIDQVTHDSNKFAFPRNPSHFLFFPVMFSDGGSDQAVVFEISSLSNY
jgi:hypothetical protein